MKVNDCLVTVRWQVKIEQKKMLSRKKK